MTLSGQMGLPVMLMFCMFSFTIFGSVEAVNDSAHVLGVIDTAMNRLEGIEKAEYIYKTGSDITRKSHDIDFNHVSFGCDTMVGEAGSTLSGGEKQRISIARAILKDAPVVVLDEATASVDSENEHLIQQAISALAYGKTIITIAHRLATIQNADQILVVDNKTIAQRGTHDGLLAQEGVYKRFIEIRKKAEGWSIG